MKKIINLNPDKELVIAIKKQIEKNNGHCCCAIIFNDDNLCMCKNFKDKIKNNEQGYCDCGLYEFILEKEDKN